MNVAEPMSSVVPGVHGVILSILVRTDCALTGRSFAGLAGPITQLAGLKDELYRRIRDAIARWSTPPLAAAVFGSYARGTSVAHVSDIDLFVVRPEELRDQSDPLLVSLQRDAVVLQGESIRALLQQVDD